MRAFKLNFPLKGVPTFVTVTAVERDCFTVELESTDMDKERDPKNETVAAKKEPHLIVQHSKNGNWVILDQGTFEVNDEDLQALGRAIENNSSTLV